LKGDIVEKPWARNSGDPGGTRGRPDSGHLTSEATAHRTSYSLERMVLLDGTPRPLPASVPPGRMST